MGRYGAWARHLRDLFSRRFYNRLTLYNFLIFEAVTFLLAFLASSYAARLDVIQQLQRDRDALQGICSYYDNKHDEFYSLALAIYEQPENYEGISRLLESPTDHQYESDPYLKQDLARMMQGVTARDDDIEAVLIYKKLTDTLYLYRTDSRAIEVAGHGVPFFERLESKGAGREIYGTQPVAFTWKAVSVYGIAGTLASRRMGLEAGSFLVAYRTRALDRVLQTYAGRVEGRFLLVSTGGELVYDSEGQYDHETVPSVQVLLSVSGEAIVGSDSSYVQTIPMLNRNYVASHVVSKTQINRTQRQYPFFIFAVFTAIAIVYATLCLVAGTLVSRRIGVLEKAMQRIGSNNLSYRIRLTGRNDEFEEIACRFNAMCEELQSTINREYVGQIRKKTAELHALQAGINPHFLYNTLEAIRVKACDLGQAEVAEMVALLGDLYRSIVQDHTFVPIRRELALCSIYMRIFSLRYGGNIDQEVQIDSRIMDYGIPKNLLQPIVENYFAYGIREDRENSRLEIHGWKAEEDICFTFRDNGCGIEHGRLEQIRAELQSLSPNEQASYGLLNVHQRIRLVYGPRYGISIDSSEGSGTQVNVRMKAVTCEELEASMDTGMPGHGTRTPDRASGSARVTWTKPSSDFTCGGSLPVSNEPKQTG